MTNEQIAALAKLDTKALIAAVIEAREAEAKAKAKAAQRQAFGMKVSEKGALSVYGLGRFPVTLYRGQWERLIAEISRVQEFIKDNAALLAVKE